MAGVSDGDVVKLIPATGVNNLAPETAQRPSVLREAVNVDVTREGRLRRRQGRTLVAPVPGAHSLWRHPDHPSAYFAAGSSIYALGDDLQTRVVATGLSNGAGVSYALINDRVYWTNNVQSGLFDGDGELHTWAPPAPSGQPTLTAEASGGLDAGTYQVAVTYRDALGREGGTGIGAAVDVEFGGGIRLAAIPVPPASAMVTTVRVYRTGANDSVFRHVLDLPAGTPTALIGASERGRQLDTQFLAPMPAGRFVRYGMGRQWVVRDRELLWSPSMRYGLHDRSTMRIAFPAPIDVCELVGSTADAGVLIAAGDRTYWLSGASPNDFTQKILHPHGAVYGSSVSGIPATVFGLDSSERGAAWLSKQGFFCLVLPGGQLVRVNESVAVADVAERATAFFKEVDGVRQLIAAMQAGTPTSLKVRDRLVARNIGPAP